jgi:hypothetical protein
LICDCAADDHYKLHGKKEGKGKETLLPDHLQNPVSVNASEPNQIMPNYKQKV